MGLVWKPHLLQVWRAAPTTVGTRVTKYGRSMVGEVSGFLSQTRTQVGKPPFGVDAGQKAVLLVDPEDSGSVVIGDHLQLGPARWEVTSDAVLQDRLPMLAHCKFVLEKVN